MESVSALVDQLMARVDDLWIAALCASFFAMVCEAAKPKRGADVTPERAGAAAIWVSVASLLTPLLLFFDAFLTGSGALIAVIAAIGGAVLVSALVGWAIAALAPDVGRTLNRAAPVLALGAFALTAYVTWRSIFGFANAFITGMAS